MKHLKTRRKKQYYTKNANPLKALLRSGMSPTGIAKMSNWKITVADLNSYKNTVFKKKHKIHKKLQFLAAKRWEILKERR